MNSYYAIYMCFSIQVDKDLKKLSKLFNAKIDESHYKSLEVPRSKGPQYIKEQLGLKRIPKNIFPLDYEETNRIYSDCFTPVLRCEKGDNEFIHMRFHVRPNGSKEEIRIRDQKGKLKRAGIYNARVESLPVKQIWSRLFMNNHGLIPFKKFYEFVYPKGVKNEVSFRADSHEVMWAPCVYDFWESPDKSFGFYSFALITNEPPNEVREAGHDRCPIFLEEQYINDWLNPQDETVDEILEMLTYKEPDKFICEPI
ncbi:MAG: SOS response-associated peptidase family protein [Bacteriovoracaceae bacterium]